MEIQVTRKHTECRRCGSDDIRWNVEENDEYETQEEMYTCPDCGWEKGPYINDVELHPVRHQTQPDENVGKKVKTRTLLEDLRNVARDLGHPPNTNQYVERGTYAPSTLMYRFDSDWRTAVWKSGLDPREIPRGCGSHRKRYSNQRISEEELIQELHRLEEELGHPPRNVDVKERGQYSHTTFYRFGDSWDEVLRATGIDPE